MASRRCAKRNSPRPPSRPSSSLPSHSSIGSSVAGSSSATVGSAALFLQLDNARRQGVIGCPPTWRRSAARPPSRFELVECGISSDKLGRTENPPVRRGSSSMLLRAIDAILQELGSSSATTGPPETYMLQSSAKVRCEWTVLREITPSGARGDRSRRESRVRPLERQR